APLASVSWQADRTKQPKIEDCRQPFDPLVDLSRERCCELLVHPGDSAADVQRAVDKRLARNRVLQIAGLHVKFVSGHFEFDDTITIASDRTGTGDLTVSGCGASTSLHGAFEDVLVMQGWETVTVFDLSVHG